MKKVKAMENKGKQGKTITREHRGKQGKTMENKGTQGNTGEHKGNHFGHTLQVEEQKKAFDALDLDGNGKITFQEVKDQPPGPVGCVLHWDFTRKYPDLTGKNRDFIGFHTGSMGFFHGIYLVR